MNWTLFFQMVIIGIATGSLIALIALGYTLVYGIVELINFAHGEVFMLGAFFAGTVIGLTGVTSENSTIQIIGTLLLALLACMVFSAVLNAFIDRVAYRRLRNAPRLAPLIAAIGFSFILQNIAIYWKGPNPLIAPKILPREFTQYNILKEWAIFGGYFDDKFIRFMAKDVLVIGITIPLLIGMSWFVYRTRIGTAMRATAQDREAAALMGIDINRTIQVAFLIGGALAGAAGMVALIYNNSARFNMGFQYGLFAFTAAVLGGIGNLTGAVVGGLLIGLIWAMSDGWMPTVVPGWGAQWTNTVIFSILVLVLIFRPAGLFGKATTEKV
ncbi:MAG: branched-chain amino acid ABC transporter permease [Thermomicrobiales bacterium]|nr:branched-chain amino acid ABC transporter permease [Thermomicrobiales bacterium]MCO5217594.1 branched-chain amino acid ABC transporter permease [Thermomicrobiales bacterium]MCO5224100.1 branched-chain amino acid ABC transporter permease [Thermomicrobiales bacterium]MCO5226935.1 branched-chain amino acid ABC transporter permease [Thermomicrobiales bacterium]